MIVVLTKTFFIYLASVQIRSRLLTVCYYHVTYGFQSESTLCSLPECQGIPCLTQVPCLKFKGQQQDLNPQPLSLKMNTQQFSQTGQMIELCCEYLFYIVHLTVCYYHVTYEFQSESSLYSLPECQGTPCSKQGPYLKFKWQK